MPRSPGIRVAWTLGLCALAAPAARATIVEYFGLERLAREAELIVEGDVRETAAAWDEDRAHIYTHALLAAPVWHQGGGGNFAVLSELGGTVGTTTQYVAGTPQWAVGERVLVFCWRDPEGRWRTLGLNQGKFRVWTDPDSGARRIANSHAGLSFVDPATGDKLLRAPLALPYDDFLARLRTLLAPPARPGGG